MIKKNRMITFIKNSWLTALNLSKNSGKKVYVVVEEQDMDEFSDHYGETAPACERIIGVYKRRKRALKVVAELTAENSRDVAELDCDVCRYWAAPYDVQ